MPPSAGAAQIRRRRRLQADEAFDRLTSVTMRQAGNSVWFAFASEPTGVRSLYSVSQAAPPSITSLTDFSDVRAVGRSGAHLALVGLQLGGGARWSLALYEAPGSMTVVSTLSTLHFVPRGSSIVAFGDKLYFPIADIATGTQTELGAAHLATGDISVVTDFSSGGGSSLPSHIVEFAQRLFFRADSDGFSGELWTLDPDGAGLVRFPSSAASAQNPACMVAHSAQLYCSAQLTSGSGVELVALRHS
jgi:hypothetical protein